MLRRELQTSWNKGMKTHKIFVANFFFEKQSSDDCLLRKLVDRGLKYHEDETNRKVKRTRTP
jgi:hypothetical protein